MMGKLSRLSVSENVEAEIFCDLLLQGTVVVSSLKQMSATLIALKIDLMIFIFVPYHLILQQYSLF